VRDLLGEQNGLLFVHGISGSGKNHTLKGAEGHTTETGIIQKVFEALIESLAHRFNRKYVI
jgi:hypothetical protein